jgi:hypothetical protein
MARRTDTDRVRDAFGYDNLEVTHGEIRVYYLRDPRGVEWVPYSGGPLYRKQAIESAAWLARHVEEFRALLPKAIRSSRIVFGELDTRTFPGKFRPQSIPAVQG